MNNFIYVAENVSGKKFTHYDRQETFEWYEKNNGVKIISKTKDLFPTIKVIVDAPNVDTRNIMEDDTLANSSVNKRKYIAEYEKKNIKQVKMNLNYKTDKEIIDKLGSVVSMQGYIKSLILKDIQENNFN